MRRRLTFSLFDSQILHIFSHLTYCTYFLLHTILHIYRGEWRHIILANLSEVWTGYDTNSCMADIRPLCTKWHATPQEKYCRPKLVTNQHGNFAETESKDIQITRMTSTNTLKMTKPHSTTVGVNSTSSGKIILMKQFTISLYLASMILANSCDVELNPGPPAQIPSGVCAKAVKWTHSGVCCDSVSYRLSRNVKTYL